MSRPQSAYKEVLIGQEVQQAKARQLVAEVLVRHGMGSADAVDLAARVPVLLGRILLEIRNADYAKYAQGQPIGEGLNSQIPDYMEERGIAKIVTYLHQLGVPPNVLGRVLNRRELFFSDVVAKVQFIQSLGVRPKKIAQVLKGCNRFFDIHLESMHETIAYLMAAGARGSDVGHIIELYPPILSLSIRQRLHPMVQYLRGLGVEQRGLTRIMRRYPRLLGLSVEETLVPRVGFLQSTLGLTTAEVAVLAAKCPHVLGYGQGGNLVKNIELLRRVLSAAEPLPGPPTSNPEAAAPENGASAGGQAHRPPSVARSEPPAGLCQSSTLPEARSAATLRESWSAAAEDRTSREGVEGESAVPRGEDRVVGVEASPEQSGGGGQRRRREFVRGEALLRKVVLRKPDVLLLHTERKLEPTFRFLEEIGLSRHEIAHMIGRDAQVLLLSVDNNLRAKIAWLESLGLPRPDVALVVSHYPSILSLSRANLERKVNFLVNDMGLSPQELVRFPQYFGYDLAKRIRPRHRKLAESGLHWSLISMLTCRDSIFEDRLKRQAPL